MRVCVSQQQQAAIGNAAKVAPRGTAAAHDHNMQDPYVAVREEVENSVRVVVELHTKWLSLDSKSDNFEWTSSELARCGDARWRGTAG